MFSGVEKGCIGNEWVLILPFSSTLVIIFKVDQVTKTFTIQFKLLKYAKAGVLLSKIKTASGFGGSYFVRF